MKNRPQKTFADYLIIAISPILIMTLVGSLVFFILEVAYRGNNSGPIRWTLFWFILAAVLVGRISIERGTVHGWIYGIALGSVTGLMMATYVDWIIGCWVMLGLAWWFASKIVWDCTLLEDDEDTSGHGLLSITGLESNKLSVSSSREQKPIKPFEESKSNADIPIPRRAIESEKTAVASKIGARPRSTVRKGIVHAPGAWVVYFSLAALPLFGAGQELLSREKIDEKNDAFLFVVVYLVSALGLLLATSFLNLRRYLRNNGLSMPGSIAWGWVARGISLALLVTVVATLLPRPQAHYSLTALLDRFERSIQKASPTETSELEGTERDQGKLGHGSSKRGKEVDREEGENSDPSENNLGRKLVPSPQPSNALSGATILRMLRWLIYLALAALLVWKLKQHGRELWTGLKEILRTWKEFLRRLLNWDFGVDSKPQEYLPAMGKRSDLLSNPFSHGTDLHQSMEELVTQTMRALEAYATDYARPRHEYETPKEFLGSMVDYWPELELPGQEFGDLYNRIAYGRGMGLSRSDGIKVLSKVWRVLEASNSGRKVI